jgi:hypothetical protein
MKKIEIISLQKLKSEFVKMEIKSTKISNKEYVEFPSGTGSKITLFLTEKTKSNERSEILQNLANKLINYGAKFEIGGNKPKSGAGWVCFPNSKIYIIAKIAGKVNKGISFEQNLENDLNNLKDGISKYNHPDFINEFQKNYLKDGFIEEVENTGKKNTARPLKLSGQKIYVSVEGGSRTEDIGSSIADLIVKTKNNGSKFNLSLKYGSTVTFFNSGLQKIMTQEDFKNGNFNNPIAQALIKLFSIDKEKFIGVFTGYAGTTIGGKRIKATKQSESVSINVNDLQDFIKTVIGKGYLLVHLDNKNKVHITEINDAFLNAASKPLSDKIEIKYPVGGSAKRIDIHVETSKFYLNFNIRNKQGGIYPSHIMCDYKMK